MITNPQVVAAYKVTLLSAFVASIFNGVFGLLMAWILTRYRFPGRTLLDALMVTLCAANGCRRFNAGLALFRKRFLR